MVYTYYSVLYGGFENEKKKGKKIDHLERGFEPRIFEQFYSPWFEFSRKVWVTRSNVGNLLKVIVIYLLLNIIKGIVCLFDHIPYVVTDSNRNKKYSSYKCFGKGFSNVFFIFIYLY